MTTGLERSTARPELKISFEDREILHVDNGRIQLHAAIAFGRFDIASKLNKLGRDPSVDLNLLRTPHFIGGGADLLIVGKDIQLYTLKDPFTTGNNSEAVYFCFFQGEGLTFMGQYIAPNRVSSHHRHRNSSSAENFFNSQGDLFLWHNEEKVVRIDGHTRVEPLEAHAAFALDFPAFSFIVQEGDEFEHDPTGLVVPTIDFLRQKAIEQGSYEAV